MFYPALIPAKIPQTAAQLTPVQLKTIGISLIYFNQLSANCVSELLKTALTVIIFFEFD
jgi:hypothetical protein